jgi:stearoyl-CoA desaturase (Delta-9 desaturase)
MRPHQHVFGRRFAGPVIGGTVLGLGLSVLANMITTVYLHRALSHRALTLSRPATEGFRALNWITTGIRPRQWVAVHRKHHAFTDVEGDPHSPVLLGWRRVQATNVVLYRRAAADPDIIARYARDLPATRLDRALYDRALVGLSIGVLLLVRLLGWRTALVTAFVHANAYLAGSSAVNAIGHHFGARPYANGAGNLQWLAWATAGEGLHNNHHGAPTSANLAHRPGEVDPGWWLVRLLVGTGHATLRFPEVRVARSQVAT